MAQKTWIVQAESKSQEFSEHNQTIPHLSRVGERMPMEYQEFNKKLLCLSLLPLVPAPGILSGAENQHSPPYSGLLCIRGTCRILPLTNNTEPFQGADKTMQQRLPGKMRTGLCCCPLKFIPTQLSIHTVPWENTAPWAQLQLQSCSQTRATFKTPGLLSSPPSPDKVSRTEQLSTVKRKELFHAAVTLKEHSVEVKSLSKSRGVCTG